MQAPAEGSSQAGVRPRLKLVYEVAEGKGEVMRRDLWVVKLIMLSICHRTAPPRGHCIVPKFIELNKDCLREASTMILVIKSFRFAPKSSPDFPNGALPCAVSRGTEASV